MEMSNMNRRDVERQAKTATSLFKYLASSQLSIEEVSQLAERDTVDEGSFTLQFLNPNDNKVQSGAIKAISKHDQNQGPASIFYSYDTDNSILDFTSTYEQDYGSTWYIIRND